MFYLAFQRGARSHLQPRVHGIAASTLASVRIGPPGARPLSAVAQPLETLGLVTFRKGEQFLMEMAFDGTPQDQQVNLMPDLPLVLRW